jgi:hypothetical protein
MWAVVLVPMWLRRHDNTTESRSVDRFSTAMRVLSRRNKPAARDSRYVLVPRKQTSRMTAHVSGAAAPKRRPVTARPVPRPTARPAGRPNGRATLMARRRRMVLILGAAALLSALLAATGTVVSWPLQIVVDVVLVAYVAHLRTEARRAAAVSRQRRRATVATAPPARAPRPAPSRHTPPVEAPAVVEPEPAYDEVVEATGTDDGWQPVPVPPPTYTLKPQAPPRPEPLFDQEQYDDLVTDEPEIDEILERRRAVND